MFIIFKLHILKIIRTFITFFFSLLDLLLKLLGEVKELSLSHLEQEKKISLLEHDVVLFLLALASLTLTLFLFTFLALVSKY